VPTRERRVVKRWALSGDPRGLAVAADGTVYVGLAGPQSVIAVDPEAGRIKHEVVLDSEEIASTKELVSLRLNPAGDRLIVANGSDESVTILALPELKIVREIGLEGETVRDALPDPAGRYLYVLGRKIHVFDAEGNRELRTLEKLDPMAIATDSQGSLLAVVGAEEFANGRATSVALYETKTFTSSEPEPLQTDRKIEAAAFADDDKALVILARDWLAEKTLHARREGTVTAGDGGSMRMRFRFGDLISSEAICLPDGSGPQIASHRAPAAQNGQTGRWSVGGRTPATSAIIATSRFRVVNSPPARM